MKKLFKYLSYTLVGLIALLFITVIIVTTVIDPNQYKPVIIQQVKAHTGRDLQIEGDLSWQLWPPIGIKIGKTVLNNSAQFDSSPMVKLDEVVVDVQLLPLLSKSIVIDEIRIDGLYFHRIVDANGVTNLDDLLQKKTEPTDPQDKQPAVDADKETATNDLLKDIRLTKGISLTNVTIINEDRQTGEMQQIERFNFSVGGFQYNEWFPVRLSVELKSNAPAITSKVDWFSELYIDKNLLSFQLRKGQLNINANGAALPQPVNLKLMTAVNVDMLEQVVDVKTLNISLNELVITAPTKITQFLSAPKSTTQLKLNDINPKQLLKSLGIEVKTSESYALSSLGLSSLISFDVPTGQLSVDDFKLNLDKSLLTGKAKLKSGPILVSTFDFNLDSINVDHYLPPAEKKAAATPPAPTSPASEKQQAEPDLSALKTLDVDGHFSINKLVASNVIIDGIKMHILVKDGKAMLKPLTAALSEGTIKTVFVLDANPKVPTFKLDQWINGLQIEPLLKATADVDLISGTMLLEAHVTAQSLQPDTITKTLNGKGDFSFTNGAVKGINIAKMMRITGANESKQTDFTKMGGSFTIKNGVVNNPDFLAMSPLLRVSGKGTADLPKSYINYETNVSIVSTLEGQGGKSEDELAGITVPLLIKGPFAKPDIKLNLKSAMAEKLKADAKAKTSAVKAKAKEKVNKQVDKLKDKAPDELKAKFKSLF